MAPFSLELSASSGHTEAFCTSTPNGTKTVWHIGAQSSFTMFHYQTVCMLSISTLFSRKAVLGYSSLRTLQWNNCWVSDNCGAHDLVLPPWISPTDYSSITFNSCTMSLISTLFIAERKEATPWILWKRGQLQLTTQVILTGKQIAKISSRTTVSQLYRGSTDCLGVVRGIVWVRKRPLWKIKKNFQKISNWDMALLAKKLKVPYLSSRWPSVYGS